MLRQSCRYITLDNGGTDNGGTDDGEHRPSCQTSGGRNSGWEGGRFVKPRVVEIVAERPLCQTTGGRNRGGGRCVKLQVVGITP